MNKLELQMKNSIQINNHAKFEPQVDFDKPNSILNLKQQMVNLQQQVLKTEVSNPSSPKNAQIMTKRL